MTVSSLAIDPSSPATVFAANNPGVFRSDDAGARWKALDIPWPDHFRSQRVEGLLAVSP